MRSLELLGGADRAIERDGLHIEVECKYILPWAGRSVVDPDFENVFHLLANRIQAFGPWALRIHLTCDRGLPFTDHRPIVEEAIRLAWTGTERSRVGGYSLLCQAIPIAQVNSRELSETLNEYRERHNDHHIGIHAVPATDETVEVRLIFTASSDSPGDAVGAILNRISKAKKQFSWDKPSIVAVSFAETLDEPPELKPHSAMVVRLNDMLQKGRCDGISGVFFFWPGPVPGPAGRTIVGGQVAELVNRGSARQPLPAGFSI